MSADPIGFQYFSAFGLVVACDRELPFEALTHQGKVDFTICNEPGLELEKKGLIHRVVDYPNGPLLCIYRQGDRIEVDYDRWIFSWSALEPGIRYGLRVGEVRADWPLVMERVVLPLYVMTRSTDILAIHGSAVETKDGRAWVFIGESGAGKSTTALELLSKGGRLLADDMTLVDLGNGPHRARVLSGSPSLRLWKEEGGVPGSIEDRRVHGLTPKRWFRLSSRLATTCASPLGGIIWLDPCDASSPGQGLGRLKGQEGLASLLRQSFDFTASPREWMTRRLRNAGAIFSRYPLIRYRYVPSTDGAPTHVEELHEWLTALEPASVS